MTNSKRREIIQEFVDFSPRRGLDEARVAEFLIDFLKEEVFLLKHKSLSRLSRRSVIWILKRIILRRCKLAEALNI